MPTKRVVPVFPSSSATKSYEERLGALPAIKAEVDRLLAIAENERSPIERVDEAEDQIVEGIRRLGHGVMQSWAERECERAGAELGRLNPDAVRDQKKSSSSRPRSAESSSTSRSGGTAGGEGGSARSRRGRR